MTKNYIKFLFGSALALSLNTQAQTNACNELFITEIVYAKDQISVSGNSPIDKSYAVELFNPKGTNLDLTGYSIKLAQSNGPDISVNLAGIISPKGKFTVAFSGSDVPLTAIADLLKSDLNFEEKTRLELWGPNGIIDRIGQVNLSQADIINLAAALADPVNYLNTLNLNLTSLQNFTARRKYTENQGDPIFAQPADKWTLAQNGDISNLGLFYNSCSTIDENSDGSYGFSTIDGEYLDNNDVIHYNDDGILDKSLIEGNSISVYVRKQVQVNYWAPAHTVELSGAFSGVDCNQNNLITTLPNDVEFTNTLGVTSSSFPIDVFDFSTDCTMSDCIQSINVEAFHDNEWEGLETFVLYLMNPVGGAINPAKRCMLISLYDSPNPNGIKENISNPKKFYTFKEPFSDNLILRLPNQKKAESVLVYDMQGNLIVNKNGKIDYLNISNISNGLYIIKAYLGKETYITKFSK